MTGMQRGSGFVFIVVLALCASPAAASAISVEVLPERPLLVLSREGVSLHCDFLLYNGTDAALKIDTIEVTALDAAGRAVLRRFVSSNGMPGGIATLPQREVAPGGRLLVFNPLHTFDARLPIAVLRYRFLLNEGEAWRKHAVEIEVRPQPFRARTKLVSPLTGRVLVHDGHEFLAHHRRLDPTHEFMQKLGVTGNSGRYAVDLVAVDASGRMYDGRGTRAEEWFGWNAPVRAAGSGIVVAAENDIPDNGWEDGDPGAAGPESLVRVDPALTLERPVTLAGNYVIIDHGNGEWSLTAHLRRGSVTVKPGDRVRAGQLVGALGNSGDSQIPHVHFQLQNGPDIFRSEGLPARFDAVRSSLGSKTAASNGVVDSGDIIIVNR
jgi:hypothetical protein